MSDLATNDGKAGHQTRHHDVLVELVKRLRSVWGAAVEYEPKDYRDYSDGRPDVAIHKLEGLWLSDVKVKDPLGSRPEAVDAQGAYVAFGSTVPRSWARGSRCWASSSAGSRATLPPAG